MASYPRDTGFRMILLTDALSDPSPEDWGDMGIGPGAELRAEAARKLLELLREMKVPLYVVLVGEPPEPGEAPDRERTPGLVLEMVRAANGALAEPAAQSLAAFFDDDGLLLKKFVFRVEPTEGLRRIEPVVKRIVAAPRPAVELQFLGYLVLPLSLTLFVLLGILVRSFPGPGDLELIEMHVGVPVHVAADRLHKLEAGGWSGKGLSLVGDARQAAASFVYMAPQWDVNLNLDYMAKNFDSAEAERILRTPPEEQRRIAALDFLRAKAHLFFNGELRRALSEFHVHITSYGKDAERKELASGSAVRIGRYRFVVKDVSRGGRKDARLSLYYDRVPSLLGLKTLLPDLFQRAFRLRRSSQRVVA
jgi:hypothetical protein